LFFFSFFFPFFSKFPFFCSCFSLRQFAHTRSLRWRFSRICGQFTMQLWSLSN
jgi:hypothetical protein